MTDEPVIQPFRVLVCGGRHYGDKKRFYQVLDKLHRERLITLVINRGASGADFLARLWGDNRKVKVETYTPDWEKHGPNAGPIRNSEMLKEGKPHLVVAFPGGNGTSHMRDIARKNGVEVLTIEEQP